MSLCIYCANLINENETNHHPSIFSLLKSVKSCPLCKLLFRGIIDSDKIKKIVADAEDGLWTRSVIQKISRSNVYSTVHYRRFAVTSARRETEGELFALASSMGE
jgi:hypothetical protein